jgi:hypothetical protein
MSEADIQGQPEQGAEQQFDASAVMDRLEQLSGEVGTIREAVQPPEPEPDYGYQQDPYQQQDPYAGQQPFYGQQPPQQPNPYGYGYAPQPGYGMTPQQVQQQFHLDPANVYDDYGNVNPQAAQQYQRMLQESVVNPAIQQAVMPLMQQVEDMRLDAESDALVQKYPEYNDEAKAKELVEDVMGWARQAGIDPHQAKMNTAILEQRILIRRAQEQAAGQGAPTAGAAGNDYQLEGGQGAGPAGQPATFADQVDAMQREMGGGAAPQTLNFWGIRPG